MILKHPFSLVLAVQMELRENGRFPRERTMSDSAINSPVKLSYQEGLGLHRMERTAVTRKKEIELSKEELKIFSLLESEGEESRRLESNEYLRKYLETLEVRSDYSGTDSGFRTEVSSVVDPSEIQPQLERGRKSGMKLLVLCCAV